jgi:hypothetical protein
MLASASPYSHCRHLQKNTTKKSSHNEVKCETVENEEREEERERERERERD